MGPSMEAVSLGPFAEEASFSSFNGSLCMDNSIFESNARNVSAEEFDICNAERGKRRTLLG